MIASESGDLRSEARHRRMLSVPRRSVRKTVCAKSLPEDPETGSEGSAGVELIEWAGAGRAEGKFSMPLSVSDTAFLPIGSEVNVIISTFWATWKMTKVRNVIWFVTCTFLPSLVSKKSIL